MSTNDETITVKEQWYDLKPYHSQIQQYVKGKRHDLNNLSQMQKMYEVLYKDCYAGASDAKVLRYPHAAEIFKVYKTTLIESSLSGYSALVDVEGEDAPSMLKAPHLKDVMTKQFKRLALLEKLSGDILDDWCLKGEAVAFIKLKETKEEYKIKNVLKDATTGEEVASYKVKEGVSYKDVEVERIDPIDFFVDAVDYEKNPKGCAKIIRSYIDAKTLLSSDNYPLLSQEDKEAIITKFSGHRFGLSDFGSWLKLGETKSTTDSKQIEVLTFYGDIVTTDNKLLNNVCAVLVGNELANVRYNQINTNRIIYAPYKIDDNTHRGISPLCNTIPVDNLINKVTDMFIKNLDDVSNPFLMYQKGALGSPTQVRQMLKDKRIEYNDISGKPEFWQPPAAAPNGIQLMQLILQQNKNVLGLNSYMAGDSSGAVRTAEESSILFQKANARMRVETDVFSYRFMLNLFNAFYAFNRELAIGYDTPLDPIYGDTTLKVSISTNASRADRQGELERLMRMLQLPIAQMIFSNLNPEQTVLAVRYIMAKSDLTDIDNLLQLTDNAGNIQVPEEGDEDLTIETDGVNPPPTM